MREVGWERLRQGKNPFFLDIWLYLNPQKNECGLIILKEAFLEFTGIEANFIHEDCCRNKFQPGEPVVVSAEM